MTKGQDKRTQKQQLLVERTMLALGLSEASARSALSVHRQQSLRLNPLAAPIEQLKQELDATGVIYSNVSWIPEGVHIQAGLDSIRDSELVTRGAGYIQNAASWLPVIALDPKPGETILDMCAAPGGKTSHIAARTHNKAHITANDNSRPRLHKLQANLKRLGVEGVIYTLHDATQLTRRLEGTLFDKILLDAPCSGEGMMSLHVMKDFDSWSVAHIKRLQQLQKKLIVQAWQLLAPGGTLVYSTCTMAPDENEAVIDYLLRRFDDVEVASLADLADNLDGAVAPVMEWNNKAYHDHIARTLRLAPTPTVEAFYVAKLTKSVSAPL